MKAKKKSATAAAKVAPKKAPLAKRAPKKRARKARNPDQSAAKAMREFKVVHWGVEPSQGIVEGTAPNPALRGEALVALGELVSVVYETKKGGDRELVQYEHEFGRGWGKTKGRPILAFNSSGLVMVGGEYTVNVRGIVG